MAEQQGYRVPEVCKIVGISYRQLDYWARTGLVKPSIKDAHGSGTQRLYSFQDLVHLKVIKNLLDAGVNLPQIRKAVEFLKEELKMPLDKVTLVSDGRTVYAATSDQEYIDLLRRGQGVIAIALGPVFKDLQGSLKELLPEEEVASAAPVRAGSGGS